MRRLLVEVDCGAASCSSVYGSGCSYMTTRRDGTEPRCALFGRMRLGEGAGWAQRCKACLDAEAASADALAAARVPEAGRVVFAAVLAALREAGIDDSRIQAWEAGEEECDV